VTRFDRYLLAESLPPLLFGLLLYSTLAVVSVTLPRLQWIVGVPVGELAVWLLLLFPNALVQTLPLALLLAVLLTFGRLAASNELLAAQAGGVRLRRMMALFLLLGASAAASVLVMNERVVPAANARVGSLYWELASGGSGLFRLAQQNVPLGDYVLHFERTDRRSDELFGVRLSAWQERRLTVVFAERARFEDDGLRLYGYRVNVVDLAGLDASGAADEVLRALIRTDNRASDPAQSLLITTSGSYDELITRFSGGGFEDSRSISNAYRDANNEALAPRERRQAAVLFHRKLAEPFANLTLLLVAVPLALLYARSRSVAFGLSLVVTLVWYLLFTLGQLFAQAGSVPVWLGVWAANGVLGALGFYLFYFRTNLR
jgi:lipopolysaccharide export system permease protein